MTTAQYIKLGRQTALISFLLGTIIFGVYFMSSSFELLYVGCIYLALMGLINMVILIFILIKAKKDEENRKKLLHTIVLMLLNVPIAILYCWMVVFLLNTMRITFTNSSKAILTDIEIIGCGGGHIDKLAPGESKTRWVSINRECSLSLNYLANGQAKQEYVANYITRYMGQKIIYYIGSTNKLRF